jgi:hypothetical protein
MRVKLQLVICNDEDQEDILHRRGVDQNCTVENAVVESL